MVAEIPEIPINPPEQKVHPMRPKMQAAEEKVQKLRRAQRSRSPKPKAAKIVSETMEKDTRRECLKQRLEGLPEDCQVKVLSLLNVN